MTYGKEGLHLYFSNSPVLIRALKRGKQDKVSVYQNDVSSLKTCIFKYTIPHAML